MWKKREIKLEWQRHALRIKTNSKISNAFSRFCGMKIINLVRDDQLHMCRHFYNELHVHTVSTSLVNYFDTKKNVENVQKSNDKTHKCPST